MQKARLTEIDHALEVECGVAEQQQAQADKVVGELQKQNAQLEGYLSDSEAELSAARLRVQALDAKKKQLEGASARLQIKLEEDRLTRRHLEEQAEAAKDAIAALAKESGALRKLTEDQGKLIRQIHLLTSPAVSTPIL